MFGFIGKTVRVLALAGVALLAANATVAAAIHPEEVTAAATGSETSIPFGWVEYCERHAEDCFEEDHAAQDIDLTAAVLKKISRINAEVNRSIEPVTDMDQWGLIDRWDLPVDGKGDCEDYALLKRQKLVAAGFPRAALLLTVVKQANGEGHSVLTIKTTHGDYVLDNLTNQVKPWSATPYRFVKRQSQENQNVWVAIAPKDDGRQFAQR
jgi:predicted transglutaminase-like cysteine proteinase